MFISKLSISLAVLLIGIVLVSGKSVQETCPDMCSSEYQPQCVTLRDGSKLEFGNKCKVTLETCKSNLDIVKIEDNACPLVKTSVKTCPDMCSSEYQPQCVTLRDGSILEFGNKCKVTLETCKSNLDIVKIEDNACSSEKSSLRKCPDMCSSEYQPQCVTLRDGSKLEFGNKCQVALESCKSNLDIVKIEDNACPSEKSSLRTCPDMCSSEYQPQCVTLRDGSKLEFGNKCKVALESCKSNLDIVKIEDNVCPLVKTSVKTCPDMCSSEYQPQCVTLRDGSKLEFGNKCKVTLETCKSNLDIVKIEDNACPSVNSSLRTCPDMCSSEYQPQCVTLRDGSILEFGNKCQVALESCKSNLDIVKIEDNACPSVKSSLRTCPDMCSSEYQPQCVTLRDGSILEFGNKCQVALESCKSNLDIVKIEDNACPSVKSSLRTCPDMCSSEYQPQCVTLRDGSKLEFGNKCKVTLETCRSNLDIVKIEDNACSI